MGDSHVLERLSRQAVQAQRMQGKIECCVTAHAAVSAHARLGAHWLSLAEGKSPKKLLSLMYMREMLLLTIQLGTVPAPLVSQAARETQT